MKAVCSWCGGKLAIHEVLDNDLMAICEDCGCIYDIQVRVDHSRKTLTRSTKKRWVYSDEGRTWIEDRLKRGISVEMMAKELDVSKVTLYRWIHSDERLNATLMSRREAE